MPPPSDAVHYRITRHALTLLTASRHPATILAMKPLARQSTTPRPPRTQRGAETRERILAAAEREIGAKGFAVASVASMTRSARVAQGTFYIYFRSKEEVMHELVLRMGQRVRRHLNAVTRGARRRLDAERIGLRAYLEFVQDHPNLYRIVEEAQFAVPAAHRQYYLEFARAYSAGLRAAEDSRQIRRGDAQVRAWALMGMATMLGKRYCIWSRHSRLQHIAKSAADLVEFGLRR